MRKFPDGGDFFCIEKKHKGLNFQTEISPYFCLQKNLSDTNKILIFFLALCNLDFVHLKSILFVYTETHIRILDKQIFVCEIYTID